MRKECTITKIGAWSVQLDGQYWFNISDIQPVNQKMKIKNQEEANVAQSYVNTAEHLLSLTNISADISNVKIALSEWNAQEKEKIADVVSLLSIKEQAFLILGSDNVATNIFGKGLCRNPKEAGDIKEIAQKSITPYGKLIAQEVLKQWKEKQ